ncbi:beta-hexosaminidase [Rhodotorula diobovata]|uniref:Beta-hexosaminidase n=1 Tax=Rhodotorula diobovata TaxID=5288 RepID=A0A5C5FSG7_9BASI|nr:beta-hexosaminidase [Rhodotorula diobovata]
MRRHLHLLYSFLCFSVAAALWPKPQSLHQSVGFVRLADSFDLAFTADKGQQAAARDLEPAISRARRHLAADGLQRLTVDRGESQRDAVEAASVLCRLDLRLNSTEPYTTLASQLGRPYEHMDESYTLEVPDSGNSDDPLPLAAKLSANTSLGLVRGLDTFAQLVYALPQLGAASESTRYIPHVPLRIVDRPAFPHRAFMLDTSRNFYPVSDILRTLDTMASVKLNVFHWHIVDSQSWPLDLPTFPDLAQLGSYSRDEVYRLEAVKQVVDHAASLGIAVLLEIDMPGHTAAVAAAYPNFVACLDARPWSTYAAEPPAGQLRLGDPDILAFSQRVLADAAKMSSSSLMSTGGDEVNERCYLDDPYTAAAMAARNATLDELLADFVSGLHSSVRANGKTPVVWEEAVLNHDLALGKDAVVTVWINSSNVRAVADKGYRIVHAASDFFYLDCGAGAWLGNMPNGTSWCDPFKSWQKSYSFDPYLDLDVEQRHLVLGGEALVWSEQASPENLDSISWPRAAAAAEVFWTGGAVAPGERSIGEALARLHDWRYRAVCRGVRATALQPHWCALRPGSCDLE